MKNKLTETYKFRINFTWLFDLAIGAVFIFLGYIFVSDFSESNLFFIIFGFILILIGLVSIILFLNYLNHSLKYNILVDFEKEVYLIKTKAKHDLVNFNEIEYMEIHDSIEIGNFAYSYNYAKFFTSRGKVFVANNLMTNNYFAPSGIKPMIFNKLIPIINLNAKRQELPKSEYDEYLIRYSEYSNKKLEDIINAENGYRKIALKAAKKTLNKRKKAHNKKHNAFGN